MSEMLEQTTGFVMVGEKEYEWKLDIDNNLFICNNKIYTAGGFKDQKIRFPYELGIRLKSLDIEKPRTLEEKRQRDQQQILKNCLFLEIIGNSKNSENLDLKEYIFENLSNRQKTIMPFVLDLSKGEENYKFKLKKDYEIELLGKYNIIGRCVLGVILNPNIEDLKLRTRVLTTFQYIFDTSTVENEYLEDYVLRNQFNLEKE